jgi:Tfp pilus assembly protein FimT
LNINMRFILLTAFAALAVASTSSAAPSCAVGQQTCNGVCFDSTKYTCCPAGLCASGSYCGQDSNGKPACCAQNTAGVCSAASTPTSLSKGATASSASASATSVSASASASQSSTASSSGAAAGHADTWFSNVITYAAGGILAALI